jgi:hypothetical protein
MERKDATQTKAAHISTTENATEIRAILDDKGQRRKRSDDKTERRNE